MSAKIANKEPVEHHQGTLERKLHNILGITIPKGSKVSLNNDKLTIESEKSSIVIEKYGVMREYSRICKIPTRCSLGNPVIKGISPVKVARAEELIHREVALGILPER